jgi:hypothetical protein
MLSPIPEKASHEVWEVLKYMHIKYDGFVTIPPSLVVTKNGRESGIERGSD